MENKVQSCTVKNEEREFTILCEKKFSTLIFHLYPNKDFYFGQWSNGPNGYGILYKRIIDPVSKYLNGSEIIEGEWRNGKLLRRISIKNLCNPSNCNPGLGIRTVEREPDWEAEYCIGYWDSYYNNEAVCYDLLYGGISVRKIEEGKFTGEAVTAEWETWSVEHAIWEKGKKTRTIYSGKMRAAPL
ncbi:hypothetical protein EHQ57_09035 [Leptospira wolffii]|uniref:hypothetical protein n=1 Tax=Leptospira wolffii TaxID=409998 RepID=UPI00108398DC|nr:hypothetical protein [Leptospira wolffii]TGK55113.1 hypothetical protein EHQ32_17905 [Leptospira wolffii]TGK70586.1 hypothetical protein EHQ35_16605 [Leptospira wolffii]TGL29877.1 hypothetical protein EHQ57_09035 [Leptospira wolffii]